MATFTVPGVLGGELVLGGPMNQGGALAGLVRAGLPVEALFLLAERMDLRQAEISEKIGIPHRTLTRRLAQHARLPNPTAPCVWPRSSPRRPRPWAPRKKPRNGSRPPIEPCAAAARSTSWTPTPACVKSKTFWAASPTASIADAYLEDLPPALCGRGLQR